MTEPQTPETKPRVPLATILTVFALILVLAAVWKWSPMLLMAFGAILIAIALRGGGALLHRWLGIGLKTGIMITALVAILAGAAVIAYAGPAISTQFRELMRSLPQAWEQVTNWLNNSSAGQFIERQMANAQQNAGARPSAQSLPSVFGYVTGTISTVFGKIANLALMITVAIFLALDAQTYRGGGLRLVPLSYRTRAAEICDEIGRALGRWMAGQALDMAVVALATFLGLWLLGVPLALVLGIIAGLTNIIPVVGPFISGVPAVLFALTQGVDLAVYVAILYIVIQQLEGNLLMPLIQRFAADLPPAMTVLAILAFGSLFGFSGVILATPLLLVSIILVKRVYVEDVLGDRKDD
ncbi:AI-2E family transporter [Paracoccus sp. 11-3]|uniref:AI-2E family transporter n=1 Tax=Paracoccus amoyensis TaxID=2760093 RepID=A0A926GDS0_9RHOB|nr:AI-2E family transporter [Paracoccus amoyensis]MBC9246646.1 AI-2E family transporter [Paracoccus amoyensis]